MIVNSLLAYRRQSSEREREKNVAFILHMITSVQHDSMKNDEMTSETEQRKREKPFQCLSFEN